MTEEQQKELILKLRSITGEGYMLCKLVLEIAHWDIDQATKDIRTRYSSNMRLLGSIRSPSMEKD